MSDSGAEVVQGGLGPSHPKDPSVSTEYHSDRFSDIQTEGTEQDLHYGSQTDNRSHTDRQRCAAGPGQDQALQQGGAGGMVVVSGTEHRQPLPGTEKLEYKKETGMEELSREHPARNLSSESFSTASPLPLSPNKDKVPDHKEDRGMEQPQTTLPTQATQASHRPLSEVKEQAGILQKSEQPITDNCERKQTDISTEPKITMQNSNDDKGEMPGANAVEQGPQEPEIPTEPSESRHVTLGSSHTQMLLPAPPTDVSGTPQPGAKYSGLVPYTPPGSGNSTPSYSTDRQSESDNEKSPPQPKEQIEANGAEEETEMAEPSANLTMQSQSSFLHETSGTAATPHVHHLLSLELDSMQTEQSVEVQMSNPEHVTRMETPVLSAHVLSTDTQGAVMLGGETSLELSEEVQVNQCILPEEHDVIELNSELSSGETKLFIEGTHSDIEMSQLAAGEFEIYSFAEEEIATEVVGERLSLSPSYEVNLFNPLIEHSENCTASEEGQDIHLPSPPQMGNDNDQAIIQQGPLSSDHGFSEMEVCSNDFIPSLSAQDVEMTDERYNLEPENTTTEVDAAVVEDSSEVDLVITVPGSDTTVGQADTYTQATAPCMETSTAVSDHRGVSVSPTTHLSDTQKLPGETEVGSTTSKSSLVSSMEELTEVVVQSTSQHSIEVLSSPITESKGQNCPLKVVPGVTLQSTTEPESCVSSHEGPENPQPCPTLTETPVHTQQDVDGAVNVTSTTEVKPEASRSALSSGVIDPKLLLLKRGDTPLLKHPPSLLLGLCVQQSNSLTLPSARSPSSGSDTAPVVECPPKAVAAAVSVQEPVALCIHRGQTEPSVKREPTAALPSTNTPSQPRLLPPSGPTPCKSDRGALTSIKTSMGKAVTVSQTLNPPTIGNTPSMHLSDPKLPSTSGNVMRSSLSSSSCDGSRSGPLPVIRPRLAGVKGPGISSAKEESSDGEADLAVEAKPGRRSMVTHSPAETKHEQRQSRPDRKALFSKVRQWIADRVTPSSSPFSPCSSPPSPSPSSSSDWTPSTTPLALRGPRGRFLSPPSMGLGGSSPSDPVTPYRPRMERHADMAELAKHEAEIEGRTLALKREGFWSIKRLTRLTEPLRPKVHWDYLCEEMQWLSADFAQERRWKRGVARKVVRMVMRHHEDLRQKEEKAKRDEHAKIRRVASNVAKEVRAFWGSVEKVVQYKQQSRLEEKRKKALDLQLDFIVGQTEKYSDLLSQALETAPAGNSEPVPSPPKKSLPPAVDEDDRDFEPPCGEEEDDEETIDVEEAQDGNDAETQRREMELLRQEGTMSLAELLSTLKRPHSQASEEECSDNSSTTVVEDEEFTANEEDAEDEEDTIAAQEVVEGEADHAGELDDLAKEGDMTVEELLEKYKGAYASDFEEPSASASPASTEESENSGDEEEESEEEESDVESNTTSSDDEDSEEDEVSDIEEEDSEEDECGEGMEILLKEGDHSPPLPSGPRPKKEISHIAATAESLQPKGYTLATTKVKTPIPFLLVGQLREYQHIGLDWLVTMYEKKLNGILADEMGLGKTIQTIALLAHLACEKSNWGPHLIIVPTSVMLNWEMELKRWCPGFKILTYYGSQKERKLKRQGWTKPNAFHVCITSYKLVLQDHQAFRRKSWRYLILDEAQNIKNFKSQRWQSLLNFNSQRRLLLTGTPLQNSLMELWSLMHFLMPHVFQSHREFKEWFSNPLTGMIEGSQEYNEGLVKRLHKVLRPFLLRRIKVDVEKQMPKKYEHVVRCRLSKRQRFLYDDFMAQASTRETLASGHFMSVINILMQLRKVCNHPNLFDPRPIHSPFITKPIVFHTASLVQRALDVSPFKLQTLHTLLRRLKEGQHRVLIFTQMTRMLDVLEQFLNYHGHIYLRLDGSTRVEQRQSLMDRFNADRRIFCFILSTRSGGVGVNLTGADTVVFYDSDWNPTMDAQAQDRCHRIGQTRDVHIYRLISERTVEENILKKANQKRMLGDMAIEGGNFTTAFFKQQTIRELFDVNEGEKKEVTPEPSVPQPEEEETGNKQSTTILEQALCRAEDEEDIVAASQAKAEQVAELAEFNEAIPLDEAGEGRDPEEEELSKAEQEIAALVEQLTPIERYAMNFLEASLEDVCKEELKQAEEQVEAARKGLDQAKEEGLKLHAGSSDNDDEDFASQPVEEPSPPGSGRRPRKHKEKGAPSTRISGRLRGATASPPPTSPEPESDSPTPREVPERLRSALRGRGGTKDNTTTPSRTEHPRAQPSSSKESAKPASTTPASPSRDSSLKSGSAAPPLGSQSHSSSVPSTATSPLAGKSLTLPGDSHTWSPSRERAVCITSESTCPVDHQSYSAQARDYDIRDQESLSPNSVCPLSRSPRKRQSADGEVLLGLPEHSPSAKVLRKLPGRLVTVVEDKEPRKRRRRGSGTGGGSSEETENAESGRVSDEPSRGSQTPDKTSQTPEEKGTASKYSTTTKLTEDQESPSTHTYPARSYLPYSPPHQSPDMPVLRNLPVRQRLESESRVAAQLGELGRGRGGNYHRKMDNQPGKDGNVSSPANNANSTPPVKRKRGRPPKTPLRLAVSQPEHASPPQPTSASEGSPALSPKRKRGRPRKDSTTVKNAVGAGHNSNSSTTSQPGSLSEAVNTEPLLPSAPTEPQTVAASAICTSQDSLSTKAEDSTATLKPNTKTEVLTTTPTAILALSPAQILTTTAIPAPSRTRVPISIPISVSTSSSATISTPVPILVPATSSPTVPALNSISVPASSSSTVSTLSLPTVSTSRPPFSPTSRSSSGLIRIPTAVLTSTLAQFLTSRPRVSTSPPISTTTTQIVTPTPNKISTPPLAQITIPTPAQISKMATSVSTPTMTPTPAPTPTLTNVKQTPTPCPTTIVATHVPTLRKLTTTSIANLTTISTSGPSIIVTTVTQARTATITATTSIPTSTKITITTPTPAPTPTTTLTSTPAPTTTVTTVTPAPTTTVTTVTPAPTTTVTTVTPAPTTTVTTVTPAPTTTVTTSTPPPPRTVTTATPPPPRTVTTATPPPPRTVTTSTPPPPRTVTTSTPPPPRTVTTATVAAATTITSTPTPISTPTPTRSQVHNSTTNKIVTQISTPAPTPSSTLVLPLAQIPITSTLSSNSTAVAATENQAVETAQNPDSENIIDMEVETQAVKVDKKAEDGEEEISDSQPKKRKVENSPEAKDTVLSTPSLADPETPVAPRPEETDKQKIEESAGDDKAASKKRPLSRQSSQESVRSSSPSSVCSTSNPTRSAQYKKSAEKRAPAKRRRGEVLSDPEKGEGKTEKESTNATRRRQSRSSSSDSDPCETRKERLTRSSQSWQEKEGDGEGNRRRRRPARSSEWEGRTVSNNTGTGESGSETSSVRVTRKSSGPLPTSESKPQSNSVPSTPPQPEVLGKRCSALNAAAKLLAMRGRVDTPGSRKDPAAKAAGQNAISPTSSDKNHKSKSKSAPATPQTNCNNKAGISKMTPTKSSRTAARSTRQCPGALVPPLETDNKRGSKKEESEKEKKKPSEEKEEGGERETRSSRGHSACSSVSSDGGGSSRSSSNSSQRTHSLSSQSTGPRLNSSRAPSSSSERERSTERGRRRSHRKEGEGWGRETRKERKERHAQKRERLSQEGNAGSGEGTPDRVLRSVAAMAAAQARTPAANTRSSRSSSAQHNKT
ncbi:uncharacterized protein LOC115106484 [Oncorhynchus nerka]|uniref:uncharacterized protein LOC115106484 n=1 Tax=Oncorhynchus nerka TaxID=8023 RepID=UPI0031B85DE1